MALTATRRGVDLADAVITELGRAAGCACTVTFDQRATGEGAMTLLGAQPSDS